MNNKIKFIQMLAIDVEEEQEYFKKYKEEKIKCEKAEEEQGRNFQYWRHPFSKMRIPSRTKIKDDCKMIRRLALEISKEEI